MPYVTIESHLPLLVARRVGEADAKSVTSMLAWVAKHLNASRHKLTFVYDAGETPGGLPDAAARRAGGEWVGRHQSLLREKCCGLDFAFASPLSRGALTAVFWFAQPPIPWAMHASLRAAVQTGIDRTKSTLDVDQVVRDLGRRPSV